MPKPTTGEHALLRLECQHLRANASTDPSDGRPGGLHKLPHLREEDVRLTGGLHKLPHHRWPSQITASDQGFRCSGEARFYFHSWRRNFLRWPMHRRVRCADSILLESRLSSPSLLSCRNDRQLRVFCIIIQCTLPLVILVILVPALASSDHFRSEVYPP